MMGKHLETSVEPLPLTYLHLWKGWMTWKDEHLWQGHGAQHHRQDDHRLQRRHPYWDLLHLTPVNSP